MRRLAKQISLVAVITVISAMTLGLEANSQMSSDETLQRLPPVGRTAPQAIPSGDATGAVTAAFADPNPSASGRIWQVQPIPFDAAIQAVPDYALDNEDRLLKIGTTTFGTEFSIQIFNPSTNRNQRARVQMNCYNSSGYVVQTNGGGTLEPGDFVTIEVEETDEPWIACRVEAEQPVITSALLIEYEQSRVAIEDVELRKRRLIPLRVYKLDAQ